MTCNYCDTMKNYECTTCKHVFKQKSSYESHLKRKKPCKSVDVDKDVTNDVGKETDTDMKLPSTTAETEVPTTKVVTLESLYNEIETLKADNLMLWKILILMTSDLEIIQTLLGLGNLKKKENK